MRFGRLYFGYNAIANKDRRQAPAKRVLRESEVLSQSERTKLLATVQDQLRNHSLIAWMVRKHLDYVSKFHMSFRTGREDLDALVNHIFRWHGAPRNIDYMGRFGRDEFFRLYELEKVTAGDAGALKLAGLKLQAIESDLITKGVDAPDSVNDSGLVVDAEGRVVKYAICNRGKNGRTPTFDHLEPRDNLIFDGYWTRFSSQLRGVSPLSTAINTVQDISEAFEFNIIKAKMHALFGLAILRKAQDTGDMGGAGGATSETADAAATAADTELDLNLRTVNVLDLEDTDDVKVLESGTPSTEFVNASYLYIQIAMLALDIPVTAFDSRRSSFSARIADLNEYEVSSDSKRTKNRYVRQDYSDWVLRSIWEDSSSPWPLRAVAAASGYNLRDVQESVEWVPSGSPWLDKKKQIQGDELGIKLGLDNAIDAARRKGSDVFANIDKQAIVLEYARKKDVPLVIGGTTDRTAIGEDSEEDTVNAEPE